MNKSITDKQKRVIFNLAENISTESIYMLDDSHGKERGNNSIYK